MKLLFVGSETSWYLSDLRRAAGTEHELHVVGFSDLTAEIDSSGVHRFGCVSSSTSSSDLSTSSSELSSPLQADAILVRTMPPATLEHVVFRMDVLHQIERAGVPVVNPAKTIEAAVDKYLTLAMLLDHQIPVPTTRVCHTTEQAMTAFESMKNDVVIKPIFGGEGRGITRVSDEALALRAFRQLETMGSVIYMQEFIAHPGYDLRLFVIGDEVLSMKRENQDDWRTNISRGAKSSPHSPSSKEIELAIRAKEAIGAEIAGVDLLYKTAGGTTAGGTTAGGTAAGGTAAGDPVVIEVNAVPGWQALARTLHEDIGAKVLNHVAHLA